MPCPALVVAREEVLVVGFCRLFRLGNSGGDSAT